MNVTLYYLTNKHNFDVYQSSPLSYFYEIASKVFQLQKNTIMLLYQSHHLPNDEMIIVSNYFKEVSSISIHVKSIELKLPNVKRVSRNNIHLSTDKDSGLNRNCLSLIELNPHKLASSSKAKNKRKKIQLPQPIVITCQLCEKQPALFYCKNCNEFVCLECNTKYSEHIRHELLQIENKNYEHAASIYQKEVIREISVLDNAYKKSIDWTNIEFILSSCLNGIVTKLRDIDEKAQNISSQKVNKQSELSEQIFYTLKDYVLQLMSNNKRQKNKELQRVFSHLNKKEKEITKLTSYVNLEVIKAKYNYKLLNILKTVLNMLNELVVLSTNTQNECSLRNYLIEELNNFNDDYPMKHLDYFIATFYDSPREDKEDITNLKLELKQQSKPLFSKFINPIEQNIQMNKTNTKSNTNSNTNSTNQNIYQTEYNHVNSPHVFSTNTYVNGNAHQKIKDKLITSKSTVKRRNSKYLNYMNDLYKSGCYSPKKNPLNIVFGEDNKKKRSETDLIDSSHVNPFEGAKHQKSKSKLKSSSDVFF